MAVTATNPAPYAPTSAILDFITRYRNKGLSTPFTGEVLARAGVSDSLIPRTLQALIALELMTEDGQPTETLEGLRRAPEPELKARQAAWISAVYADVLSFVNASDDEGAIRDAFRAYNPVGQQPRMVSLFLGLCRASGLRTDDQAASTPRPAARKAASPGTGKAAFTTYRPAVKQGVAALPTGAPAPIAALLTKLPPEQGSWTKAERDKFESAFKAMLDFCFIVAEKPAQEAGDE